MDQMDWGDADDFVTTGAVGADQVNPPRLFDPLHPFDTELAPLVTPLRCLYVASVVDEKQSTESKRMNFRYDGKKIGSGSLVSGATLNHSSAAGFQQRSTQLQCPLCCSVSSVVQCRDRKNLRVTLTTSTHLQLQCRSDRGVII